MKEKIIKILRFFLNPRLLLCLGIGWMITNGWSYILFTLGTALQIEWMIAVGGGYMALLWIPATPEKLITFAIAVFLLKRLFPHDEKTLGVLKDLHAKAKAQWQKVKNKKAKKN
ncbi:MAG: hypothetical protein J6J43_02910 [Oscillospiraceae bacterium]|nr:hypothetical protein [Oscillospiraceae bacterium]